MPARPRLRVVTAGRNGLVILAGPWAIKLPSMRSWRDFLFGIINNLNERDWSRGGVVPAACPVLCSAPGGLAIVMPRPVPLTDAQLALVDDLALAGTVANVEHKADSFGTLGGRTVVLDYGW